MTEGPYAIHVIGVLFGLALLLEVWHNVAAVWGIWFPW